MTAPPTGDEIAGVVDLFGALTREELREALREAAFRAGREFDAGAAGAAVDSAVASYRLVAVDPATAGIDLRASDGSDPPASSEDDPPAVGGDAVDEGDDGDSPTANGDGPRAYVVGPTAFPALPDGGEDLPHILDVERRDPDREATGEAALERFRQETVEAVDAGDDARIRRLLDVSYDLEAWAPVDLDDLRDRLDDALATDADPDEGTGGGTEGEDGG